MQGVLTYTLYRWAVQRHNLLWTREMNLTKSGNPLLRCLLVAVLFQGPEAAAENVELLTGQTLYLPIYSYIWHGDRVIDKRYPLKAPVSALVSIRNTNLKTQIKLLSVRHYDTNGKFLKQFVATPVTIEPLGTYEIFVEKRDIQGGSGANLIIQWNAATPANVPLVEAIHAEIKGHSTFTFITKAQAISGDQ